MWTLLSLLAKAAARCAFSLLLGDCGSSGSQSSAISERNQHVSGYRRRDGIAVSSYRRRSSH